MSSDNISKSVLVFFKKYCIDRDCHYIDSLIISTYIRQHSLRVENNELLLSHILSDDNAELTEFINYLERKDITLSIENLVEFFEFVISPQDKQVNGAVYTPLYIREYIIDSLLNQIPENDWHIKTYGDIACGCGGFFLTLARKLFTTGVPYEIIFQNNIFGVDIQQYSIDRCKLLLSLLAVKSGEDIRSFNFNLYTDNSLRFDWTTNQIIRERGGFDFIMGNPPYVSSSKIDDESKQLLMNWSVSQSGKPDLYIPFFQIAIENLVDNGVVGYITVNNFYRSLNGRAFRSYLSENSYNLMMIDFGAEQVFKGRSTYTCICFITKNAGHIQYAQANSLNISHIERDEFTNLYYETLSDHEGWLLQNNNIAKNIKRIEETGKPLGKLFGIRNGFATLKNDVFVLNIIKEDPKFYYTSTQDKLVFKIEKEICRDAIKPNTLKLETEIDEKIEKLIFPYYDNEGTVTLMSDSDLREKYPCAYKYLTHNKKLLLERDKGKREYQEWFAFGRSQALNIYGYKLLFPYIASAPHFVISEQKNLLFYNGYALVSNNIDDLRLVQKILKSKVFWYYIKHTSKPYGSDYFALAKNYIKNFGIVELTEEQKTKILTLKDQEAIDQFLITLYGLKI